MISISGEVQLQPERREDALARALAYAAQSRKDKGCLAFKFYQDPEDPDTLFLYELWESAGALQAHLAAPHVAAFSQELPDYVVKTNLRRFIISEATEM